MLSKAVIAEEVFYFPFEVLFIGFKRNEEKKMKVKEAFIFIGWLKILAERQTKWTIGLTIDLLSTKEGTKSSVLSWKLFKQSQHNKGSVAGDFRILL